MKYSRLQSVSRENKIIFKYIYAIPLLLKLEMSILCIKIL